MSWCRRTRPPRARCSSAHRDAWRASVLSRPLPSLTERTVVEPAEVEREAARTRDAGYAIDDEELQLGVRGVAVPVRGERRVGGRGARLVRSRPRRCADASSPPLVELLERRRGRARGLSCAGGRGVTAAPPRSRAPRLRRVRAVLRRLHGPPRRRALDRRARAARRSRPALRGRRLLDVACGTGRSFLPMLERGYDVTACDISPAMAARAREKSGGAARVLVARHPRARAARQLRPRVVPRRRAQLPPGRGRGRGRARRRAPEPRSRRRLRLRRQHARDVPAGLLVAARQARTTSRC